MRRGEFVPALLNMLSVKDNTFSKFHSDAIGNLPSNKYSSMMQRREPFLQQHDSNFHPSTHRSSTLLRNRYQANHDPQIPTPATIMDADNIPSSSQSSDVEFTLFQKLPPELRNAIWTWALPRPPTITISRPSYEKYLGQGIDLDALGVFEFFSDAVPIPCGVFHASP
jgi:hypothetical protein